MAEERSQVSINDEYIEKYGFHEAENNFFKSRKGLDEDLVREISAMKKEPEWMTDFRVRSLAAFNSKPMPNWGSEVLKQIDFNDIFYYIKPTEGQSKTWEDLPSEIKNTYDRLGIPEAEKKYLAGVGAQYECLHEDSLVYTARGPVAIRDVKAGDTVYAFDEDKNAFIPSPVKATAYKGERPVFEIKVATRIIRATENHPFLTLSYHSDEDKQRGRYKREWKYLRDLKEGDLVAVSKQLPGLGQAAPLTQLTQPEMKGVVTGRNRFGTDYLPDISNRYGEVSLPARTSTNLKGWFGASIGDGFTFDTKDAGSARVEIATPEKDAELRNERVRMTKEQSGVEVTTPDQFSGDFDTIGWRSPQPKARMGVRNDFDPFTSARVSYVKKHTTDAIGFVKIDCIKPAGIAPVYDIEVDGPHNFVAEGLVVHNSEVIYHSLAEDLAKKGVIFLDTDSALKEQPEMFREHFGTIIPYSDNKFAALNSAVWSGGSFIYVPKGVKIDMPLQAYFRINAKNVGQFERTLIIVDEGAQVHYVEGCFSAGARVRVRNGEKRIEQIAVGDEVLTHKGRYRRVYNTMQRPYQGTIYTIKYFGDSRQALRVTEEHPLLIVPRDVAQPDDKNFKPTWMAASQVKPGDYMVIPVPKAEQAESRVSSLMPITAIPASARPSAVAHRELSVRNGSTLVLEGAQAAPAFAPEFGAPVVDKRVPEYALNAPLAQLKEWVHGEWRSDGRYDSHKNEFRYNTVSAAQASAFRDALLRLGIPSAVNYQVRDVPRQPMYAVVVSSPFNARFGEVVGYSAPNGSLSASPFHIDDNFMYVPIRSVEIEEMDTTVYNFSVEEDESYVAEGVVSHNCTAPVYSSDSLHSAVVEIIVKKGGRCRYTTIQNWSTNVYNLVTKRAAAYESATMEWVDGNLGCLAEGSTVTTPGGIKTIEALNVGDEVLSYDDQTGQLCFRRVNAKRYSGEQRVHTVAAGERKLRVTSNHPFYSATYGGVASHQPGQYRLGYVRADHLQEAIIPRTSIEYGKPHLLVMPTNRNTAGLTMGSDRVPQLALNNKTTDDLMWLLGYWVGDGNIEVKPGKSEGVVRWAEGGLSTPTVDHAPERRVHSMAAVIDSQPTERTDANHLAWDSKELAEIFALNGFGHNERAKRIPAWVCSLPQSQRCAFIAGYLDADGGVDDRGAFTLKSVKGKVLEDVASLLVTLGITPRLDTEFDAPKSINTLGVEVVAHGAYRLSFPLDARVAAHVSPALRQKAEQASQPTREHRRAVGGSSIQLPENVALAKVVVSELSADACPTWDIEVEGTGNFISQGFIVHNSKLTMKYPAVYLMEPGAHGEILSIAFAGKGQHQDAGGKVVHAAPNTTSKIVSKSISKDGGRTSYRGLLKVYKDAVNSKSNVVCDALLLDEHSRSDTYPYIEVDNDNVNIGHEASVSKIGEEQLFYAMSRGVSEEDASTMVVSGFIEPLVKELPMEYAVEMNRLIALQMEGTVG